MKFLSDLVKFVLKFAIFRLVFVKVRLVLHFARFASKIFLPVPPGIYFRHHKIIHNIVELPLGTLGFRPDTLEGLSTVNKFIQ